MVTRHTGLRLLHSCPHLFAGLVLPCTNLLGLSLTWTSCWLGHKKLESVVLAVSVWRWAGGRTAGCLSETCMVNHRHGYSMRRGEGPASHMAVPAYSHLLGPPGVLSAMRLGVAIPGHQPVLDSSKATRSILTVFRLEFPAAL